MASRNTTTKKAEAALEKTKQMGEIRKDDDYRSIYVNHVTFGMTRFDFQMALGLVEITKDSDELKVRELASVKMSQAYAKALLTDMAVVIAAYEKQYGEIILPPDLKQ